MGTSPIEYQYEKRISPYTHPGAWCACFNAHTHTHTVYMVVFQTEFVKFFNHTHKISYQSCWEMCFSYNNNNNNTSMKQGWEQEDKKKTEKNYTTLKAFSLELLYSNGEQPTAQAHRTLFLSDLDVILPQLTVTHLEYL